MYINNTEQEESSYNDIVARAIASRLTSYIPKYGIIFLFLSLIIGLSTLATAGLTIALLSAISVSLGFIGGFLEFYTIILLNRTVSLVKNENVRTIKIVGKSALYTSLYYLLIGIILIDLEYKNTLEILLEKPIRDLECWKYYNPWIHLLTLGFFSIRYHVCASRTIARVLLDSHVGVNESAISLSSQAY